MKNPWSGSFTDRAEWQFKTCARNDGSYYGTADSNQCRIGTEASLPDKAEKVKKLLNGSYSDYESSYGKVRDSLLQASAEEQTNRILSTDLKNMSPEDARARAAAKRTKVSLEEIDEFNQAGNALAATKIGTKKELFDDMKWLLLNEQVLVSEGTLNEAWSGTDLAAKANATYGSKAFGQSRVAVFEHPVPTHSLKTDLISSKDRSLKGVSSKVIKNSILSLTSAKEDNKINSGGFKDAMPDKSKPLSRYERGGVKTFALKKSMGNAQNTSGIVKKIQRGATEAKEKKMTKEEWIASIIEGMENM